MCFLRGGGLDPSVIIQYVCVCSKQEVGQLPQDVEDGAETVSFSPSLSPSLSLHQHSNQSTLSSMKSDLTGYTMSDLSDKNVYIKDQS